jgi:hypothetical protein
MNEEIYTSKDGPKLLEFRLGHMVFMGPFYKKVQIPLFNLQIPQYER